MNKKIKLEDYFTYHPPVTTERINKHNNINNAALEFAKVVLENTDEDDFSTRQLIINNIQIARMLANQSITFSEVYFSEKN